MKRERLTIVCVGRKLSCVEGFVKFRSFMEALNRAAEVNKLTLNSKWTAGTTRENVNKQT